MAWSGFPAIQSTDWSALTFVEQFVKAVSERRQSVGQSALSNPAVGWDVQSAAASPGVTELSWRYLQSILEGLVTSFVNSHDSGGNIRATDYYDGRATIDMWTQAAWRTAAGINASGFTRKYPDGAGGTTTAYGLMQAGDYIGPWIFNELKAGLDLLVWTKPTSTMWNLDAATNNIKKGIEDGYATWAAVKVATKAEYDASGSSSDVTPNVFTRGDWSAGPQYGAVMQRDVCNLKISSLPIMCKRAIDYYIKAIKSQSHAVFADFGDDVLDGLWSLFSTHTPATPAASHHSPDRVGDFAVDPLPWCDEPTSGNTPTGRGWGADDDAVIVRWNVTGGFVYV